MIHSREITYNLHKLVFLLDKMADKVLQEDLKITFSQLRIMLAISRQNFCQKDIADYWDMTEAAVSRQIELLVDKKFITRKENEENRRQHVLALTEVGEKELQKALKILDKTYEKVFEVVNQKERVVLVEGLNKLLKTMCCKEL